MTAYKSKHDTMPYKSAAINSETREALAEYKKMKRHPEWYKRYQSFSQLVQDIDNDT